MSALDPRKVGIAVTCGTCGRMKQPRGRSAPMQADYCDFECEGYEQPPLSGSLWPNESESDFGYPVGNVGVTKGTQ